MKFNAKEKWEKKESDPDTDYEQLASMLETCLDHMARFNGWEEEFINDMVEKVGEQKFLSVKQREIIGNLYEKAIKVR
jgi:dissimilatory sulfite reductase (desulfoviridin) alpha/beta subunit